MRKPIITSRLPSNKSNTRSILFFIELGAVFFCYGRNSVLDILLVAVFFFLLLQKYIRQMGIEVERLKLEWISASEGKQFAELVNSFTETITELGPCKIKETMKVLT